MRTLNPFLFNFSVSYSGGGYKRLYAYAKEMNSIGGGYFIVHPNCKSLANEFKNNHYFFVKQSMIQRLFFDCFYLKKIIKSMNSLTFYYSYGIPIYKKIACINWFHLSNVLPFAYKGISISFLDKLKMAIIGFKIKRNLKYVDIISAESKFSLGLLKFFPKNKLFLSANGADDELKFRNKAFKKHNIAIVLGTYSYKSISDAYHIFKWLKRKIKLNLKLVIIGNSESVPKFISESKNVILTNDIPRLNVIEYLKRAKYYISATQIENSYNAASEGIFFAEKSFISDIEPHKELLANSKYKIIYFRKIRRKLFFVERNHLNNVRILSWKKVFADNMNKVYELIHK